MRIGLIIAGLLIVALAARLIPEVSREDPTPSGDERCNETLCVKHATPLCLPERQHAKLTLIIRAVKNTTTPSQVTLTIVDSASGRETKRHDNQTIPRDRSYDWTFDIAKVSQRAIVTSKSGSFAYTVNPLLKLCLTGIS